MEAIKTCGLTKYYGTKRGIVDLDITVDRGSFFGFIGPNGAGKSTMIRILLGLICADKGKAEVLGYDIRKQAEQLRAHIGYLPAETFFYKGMRAQDVFELSSRLYKKDCRKEWRRLCERLDLDPRCKVEELSLGNRKKVGIICALQHEPQLLILDEPTSGLDPVIQKEFFAVLKERNHGGTTIFFSSHVLSEIQNYCDKTAMIKEGKLVACGDVKELMQTGTKRITLRGDADLKRLGNIRDIRFAEKETSFLYNGDIKVLLQCLAAGNITDLSVSNLTLEEIFMHVYAKGETKWSS